MTYQSRNLLRDFFHLGICVSCNRVLKITKIIYENLHFSYFSHNCLFPNIVIKGLFTISLIDNIGVNARSIFIGSDYHRTSISIIQFVTDDNSGLEFLEVDISQDVSLKPKRLSPLLQEYIHVKKLFAEKSSIKGELWAPLCSINVVIDNDSDNDSELKLIDGALNDELQWHCVIDKSWMVKTR